MSLRHLLRRSQATHAVRAQHRAVERAMARAVSPEARHELLVLEATRR